jgi:hypothetical protein
MSRQPYCAIFFSSGASTSRVSGVNDDTEWSHERNVAVIS